MDLRCEGLESPVWRAWLVRDAEGVVALGGPGIAALEQLLLRVQAEPLCRALVIASDGGEFCRGMDLGALGQVDAHHVDAHHGDAHHGDAHHGDAHHVDAHHGDAHHGDAHHGDDLTSRQASTRAAIAGFARCLGLLRTLRVPSLCVVEGAASGGGVGLVAACDMVIASSVASFVLPELLLGLIPAVVFPVISERIGPSRARWLALSGEKIEADTAHQIGLVDEVGEDLSLVLAARLKRLLRSSPAAITRLRRFSADIVGLPLAEALSAGVARTTADVEDPEITAAIAGFVAGITPPWFARYRPVGSQ